MKFFSLSLLICLHICLVIILSPILQAQTDNLIIERISVEHGLSGSSINCILKDNKGIMWFGTNDGLNKFDGYKISVYNSDFEDANSLSNNSIHALIQDKSGIIWIGTNGGGLNNFNPKDEKFTHYKNDLSNPFSLSNNFVKTIYIDSKGIIWIGTSGGGLNRLNPEDTEKGKFIHYKYNPDNHNSLSDNNIKAIFEDKTGTLWIGTNTGGLCRLNIKNRDKGVFIRYSHEPNNNYSIVSDKITAIIEDQSETLWIGTDGGGLSCLKPENKKSGKFINYKYNPNEPNGLSSNFIFSFSVKQQGIIWIGTYDSGLIKFDTNKEIFYTYKHDPRNPNSLGSNTIWSIYEDESEILWLGTMEGGINKVCQKKKKFIHFKKNPEDINSLSDNSVWAVFEDKSGTLWIGSYFGGLTQIISDESGNKKYIHHKADLNNIYSLSDNAVLSIFEDHTSTLWVGTSYGGLCRLNPEDKKTGKFHRYTYNPKDTNSLRTVTITRIFEDRANNLWIGTGYNGLFKFNPENETFINYKYTPNSKNSISDNKISSITESRFLKKEDTISILWISTFGGGLNKIVLSDNKKSGKKNIQFSCYKNLPGNLNSLSDNFIYSIYIDKTGIIWIGTTKGLEKFDPVKEKFIHFNTKDGLSNNIIYGILEDNHNNLWLSTNKGISKFNKETKHFRNYSIADGIQGMEFNQGAYFKNKKGMMFFGGINGFNTFYPDSIINNPIIPPIIITDFKLFNENVAVGKNSPLTASISEIEQIILSHKQNFISFEFAALNYLNTEKNQYKYKMEGVDQDWVYAGKRRFVNYNDLKPGEYIFKVKGSNNDGVWNEQGAFIKITITPPFWKTPIACFLYAVFILFVLYFLRRSVIKKTQLKNALKMRKFEKEKLLEIDKIKTRFFANISHEFRTPLTLIQGPVKQLLSGEYKGDTRKVFQMILRNSRHLSRLINQLLDFSKLEDGRMPLQTRLENIISLLTNLVSSFSSLAKTKQISLKFNPKTDSLFVYIDRDKFTKIIINLLSNAVKFTSEEGKIIVNVFLSNNKPATNTIADKNNFVNITVSDTGIGIQPENLDKIFDRFYQVDSSNIREQEGTGIGLALTKELVELHHGKISVKSKAGKGTTFLISLPQGKEHLKPNEISDEAFHEEKECELSDNKTLIDLHEIDFNTGSIKKTQTAVNITKTTPLLLIVEDNSDMQEYIISSLKQYKVIVADNGVIGLEKATDMIPDLIISDVMMPKMDGFEFCKKIKTDKRTSHIPVILLTGRTSGESKIEGLETGADDYITKPFDEKELQVRVKNLIKQREKSREFFRQEFKLQPENISTESMEQKFLQKAVDIIQKNIPDYEFNVEIFAKEIGLSSSQLQRKLKALTNYSPNELINNLRLKRAAALLTQKHGTISEIAYDTGFTSPAYFSKCFSKQYGCPPKEYCSVYLSNS